MPSESDRLMARNLVLGYLAHNRLAEQSQLNTAASVMQQLRALVRLTDDYEARYRLQLAELATRWNVNPAAGGLQASFAEVLDTIFADGCNWGRVVTVFIFVGMFLRKCRAQQAAVSTEEVVTWTVDYLAVRIAPWIRRNGGWNGLVEFYEHGDVADQMQDAGQMFRRLLAIVGAASLVVLTLTSLLANRA